MNSFEINNVKKKIPSENETKIKILAIATNLGCYREAKSVFDRYQEYTPQTNPPEELIMVARTIINELYNIDPKLVLWLMNENGEIVVGNQVAMKINFVDK